MSNLSDSCSEFQFVVSKKLRNRKKTHKSFVKTDFSVTSDVDESLNCDEVLG